MKNILNSIIGRAYEQKYFNHMTIDFANSESRIIALFSQIRVCVQCDIFLFQQIFLLFRFSSSPHTKYFPSLYNFKITM